MFAQDDAAGHRSVYNFRHPGMPEQVEPYTTTLYVNDGASVRTISGALLNEGEKRITDFKVNPAGANFATIRVDKKGRHQASVYGCLAVDDKLIDFNSKKLGDPTAIGYTPNARRLLLAAGGKIYIAEPRKGLPVDTIENVPVTPTLLRMSPNGYFLVAVDGNRAIIYNFEEQTIRRDIDAGEKITDIAFSPESDQMAILTADGLLSLYNTRTLDLRKMVDNLGEARACEFNFDGKYVAVVTGPETIEIVNLLRDSDRETITDENIGADIRDVTFVYDIENSTLMAYPAANSVVLRRMPNLKPFYGKLISDKADAMMDEWLKMMPGETMEQYRNRVGDDARRRQRQLFEDEIATGFAGDMLGDMAMSLGSYDRANGLLAINFEQMPTIYVPVPETDILSFSGIDDVALSDVQYGILPDDSFEIVYATVTNTGTGKSYVYDNHNRASMDFVNADDAISIELLQQQQMEELKLQEIREKVVVEAKEQNVISDHTHIAVNSRMVPEYDANGEKILNYVVSFNYNVEPEFTAIEDFRPGKYKVDESGAASSMLRMVKEAFEGEFKQYLQAGKKLRVNLRGTADATPIISGLPYDGSFGEFHDEPIYKNGALSTVTVTSKEKIKENEQLAFVRALAVKDFLEKNIEGYNNMDINYRYDIDVSEGRGSEFRRITADFIFVDAF